MHSCACSRQHSARRQASLPWSHNLVNESSWRVDVWKRPELLLVIVSLQQGSMSGCHSSKGLWRYELQPDTCITHQWVSHLHLTALQLGFHLQVLHAIDQRLQSQDLRSSDDICSLLASKYSFEGTHDCPGVPGLSASCVLPEPSPARCWLWEHQSPASAGTRSRMLGLQSDGLSSLHSATAATPLLPVQVAAPSRREIQNRQGMQQTGLPRHTMLFRACFKAWSEPCSAASSACLLASCPPGC